ncbi:MAG: hypothetical protein ACRBCS_00360 [Cellvibrionaceae bacterium]
MSDPVDNKNSNIAYEYLEKNRNLIRSRKGGWIMGRGVMNQGYEMMEDFVGKLSYMQVNVFNVTGRIPSIELANWMEAVHICLSWPDPRIWCNHIGALGGTARTSAMAAVASGVMASQSNLYGPKTIIAGVEFIQKAKLLEDESVGIEEIIKTLCVWQGGKPKVVGYARPIAKGDERVPAMDKVRKKYNFEIGKHLALALRINKYLEGSFDESMNINGYVTAFMADHNFSAQESYQIFLGLVPSGVAACYIDTKMRKEWSFMPQRCEDIKYQGHQFRSISD